MVKEKIGHRWGWGCKRRGGLLLRPLTVNRTKSLSRSMFLQMSGHCIFCLTGRRKKCLWPQWGRGIGGGGDQCPPWMSAPDTKAFPGPGPTVVAGAVVGTLVGLGLLAGLVLLYQRRSKALEEPANDIK